MGDALRFELAGFGIDIVIQPGLIRRVGDRPGDSPQRMRNDFVSIVRLRARPQLALRTLERWHDSRDVS